MHILFTTRLTLHNKRKFVAYFAKCREIRVFIKWPRREKSRECPSQINLSYVFSFPTLLCALFPLMNFGFRFNSCPQFRENDLSSEFQRSPLSRDLPGGSMLRFIGRRHDRLDTRLNEAQKL